MGKINKLAIVFLFILIALPLVSSAKIIQASTGTAFIQIESPVIEYHTLGEDYEFHAHAYNGSSGKVLDNTTTNCTLHVYYDGLGHLVESPMVYSGNGFDYFLNVGAGNFSQVGEYVALFTCVNADSGGFFEYGFDLNSVGVDLTEGRSIFYVGVLIVLMFLLVACVTYANLLNGENELSEDKIVINTDKYLKTFLYAMSYGFLLIISFLIFNVSYAYLGTDLVSETFRAIFNMLMYGLIIALPLMFIKTLLSFQEDKNIKKLFNRGLME